MDSLPGDQAWLEVATLYTLPMALKAAIQLHVMDILAKHSGGPDDEQHYLSAFQIVSHFEDHSLALSTCPLQAASSLDRILRLLASHGLLASSVTTSPGQPTRTYGLNSLSPYLLQSQDAASLSPAVLGLQEPVITQCFYGLHESVLDGSVPFTRLHGMECYAYYEKDPRFGRLFDTAMSQTSLFLVQAMLQRYHGFKNINTLVDVGGGVGACLTMIISKYPHIKGINFDLPHVIAAASKTPEIEFVGGDMLSSIPKGEAILMKSVLHNWGDEHCLQIFKNCYKALPRKGKVIVVDSIMPIEVDHEPGAHTRYQIDLLMYALYEGGKERTKEELESISKVAGFSRMQFICNVNGFSILEFFKEDM